MYKQIAQNKRNTVLIMLVFVVIIAIIGAGFAYYFDDLYIFVSVLTISVIYAVIQYFIASAMTVAMTGAREIQKKDNPRLYNIVENLSITAGLPMPKVYIIDDAAPNAFASGRDPNHALVAATQGLVDMMDDNELTGVMAHEMSHVKNYDIRVSTIVFGLVCLIGFISDVGWRMVYWGGGRRRSDDDQSPVGAVILLVTAILAPVAAALIQMAISREREYLADASAVNLTRYPEGMINALKKLQSNGRPMRSQNSATAALYINDPLRKSFWSGLFSTHPPLEKRIERLENGKKNF